MVQTMISIKDFFLMTLNFKKNVGGLKTMQKVYFLNIFNLNTIKIKILRGQIINEYFYGNILFIKLKRSQNKL